MTVLIAAILIIVGLALLVPTLVLLVEVIAGVIGPRRHVSSNVLKTPRACVLIPAHNEEIGLEKTLLSLLPQISDDDMILVVADNCNDGTADVARKMGVSVVERQNLDQRGKGYALAYGLDAIRDVPPDVVIMIDADCTALPGSILALKQHTIQVQRPVQALNLMRAPAGHEQRFAVAEFAWRIKNLLRPLGLSRFGMPCQLMGTGMAFPWELARDTRFASGNIVEDLELGIRMARRRVAPEFFTGATVLSEFPVSKDGEISQRRRWEGGSFAMLMRHGGGTVVNGLMSANVGLMALGLDMLVPPLVLHAFAIVAYVIVSAFCALVFGSSGLTLAILLPVLFAVAIGLSWWSQGRDLLPVRMWARLFPYLLSKLNIHRKQPNGTDWVRADRNKD
jgi:cellulose synthase/poly-beta-1,6-N-acetylglucosamine synthase-like glycosyltransferase